MNLFEGATVALVVFRMILRKGIALFMLAVAPLVSAVARADDPALLFPAAGAGKHASVILLHGYRCIDDCLPDFERYAQALNAQNVDVYFLRYYNDNDKRALAAGTLGQGAAYAERFKAWTSTVRGVAQRIRSQQRSDGRVTLVGFSQGGRLAIASAANNPSIQALVVFYARLPRADELNEEIKALPPTLLLHGSADTIVPLTDGEAIYAKTRSLGAAAKEMIVYPGAGHGFDFSPDGKAAIDARLRVTTFIKEQMP